MQTFSAVVPAPNTTYNPPESINTMWCRYNSVNLLKHSHNRHTIARLWGRGMGVSVVSLKFDLCSVNYCHRSAVCNIAINWTDLLQHLTVSCLQYIPWNIHMVHVLLVSLVLVNFTHILQGYFTGNGAIIGLPHCQWSNPEGHGWNQLISKHKKHKKSKPWAVHKMGRLTVHVACSPPNHYLNWYLLTMKLVGTTFNEFSIKYKHIWLRKMPLKMSTKCWPCWFGAQCIN